MNPALPSSISSATAAMVGSVWLAVALLVGASGLLAAAPRLTPQMSLAALSLALLALFWKSAAIRTWASHLSLRALALVHVVRFVGAYFLILHARGELPYSFAVPGGWGDIAVAGTALIVSFVPPDHPNGRRVWFIWNALGLADILFVVVTAARLGLDDPTSMRALTLLPLSLLPTFVVPIIIASHVVLFVRLWPNQAKPNPAKP